MGAVTGALVGAIHDALRLRNAERWLAVVCVSVLFLVLVVFPLWLWIRSL
jgi:hypothetical protein